MSLQRNMRKMVTVQIWMNYVYRFEEMDSNDLIHTPRDWSKVNVLYYKVDILDTY
jgi:hypothetical protein